jgi:hypothetical protein
MHVVNIHRRDIASPADRVGRLVDGLASDEDRLWPRDTWPAMRFDRPGLTVGATGGHGPIGYRVAFHEPSRSVTFEFTNRPAGLAGRHQYLVQPTGADRCTLWHITEVDATGLLRLTWAPIWAPLHDALVEDSLDRAQATETDDSGGRTHWSRYVRALRFVAGRARMLRHASVDAARVRAGGGSA